MAGKEWSEAEKAALREDALRYIIPHFASNAELAAGPKVYTRGEGCYVYDLDGRKYFDSFATLLTTTCGHTHPDVSRAIVAQLEQLEFFPNYVDSFTVPLIELARKLAAVLPGELSVSFFVNSGSEANETALKMARQYHVERGERQRSKFIARRGSYHATTLGATSVTGITWFREYFEPLMPGALFIAPARERERPEGMDSRSYGRQFLDELEALIEYEGADTIAGMIMDPIPGSNTGFPLPPEGYLEGIREICDRHGILLIFDEIQTGFAKTGKWFACEHWGVVPDIITLGKGFTGGYVPLGAAVTTPKVADVFRRGPGHELRSGSTYGGHTLACAATLAVLGVIEREGLVENARVMGDFVGQRLEAMRAYPIVGGMDGIGLLRALFLKGKPEWNLGRWVRDWCHRNGMILRANGDIIVLAPSLILTREEAGLMCDLIEGAIREAMAHFGAG